MEVINIFLAGSTKLEKERNLIRSCANKLQADNCAKGRRLAINITTFENFSSAISDIKAQKLYDDYIHSDADYAMFVFDDEVGGISKHEFDIAYDAFSMSKRPTLYIYFKKADSYCPEYEEIRTLLEHSENYFQEYDDFQHLSQMIDSHLREIIDPSIEKIIIDSHRGKGYLTLISDKACSVTENGSILTELIPEIPSVVELTDGMHVLKFESNDSSETIEKAVRIIRDNKRTIEVHFPLPFKVISKPNPVYYIAGAIVLALLVSILFLPKPHGTIDESYAPDEVMNIGGDKYQLALEAIEHGDSTKAVELLKTVINAEPAFTDPYIQLAAIYIEQGEMEKARALLTAVLQQDSDNQWANDLYESIN